MTTGERIKARRKQLDYSADFLAEKLGVSRSTIFRYENGDIEKLPVDLLEPIAEALNTTPAYLMGWDIDSQIEDTELNIEALKALLAKEADLTEKAELEYSIDVLSESLDDLRIAQQLGASFGRTLAVEPKAKPATKAIDLDDFTYAMHSESQELTEEDKALLLSMARQLNAKNKSGQTD